MAHCEIIDRYCQEVEKAVKHVGSYSPFLAERLRHDLEEFLEEHPNASEAELRQHFGEPTTYALEYTATMDPQEQTHFITEKRFKRKLWLTTTAAVLAIILGLALWIGMTNSQQAANYYISDIIEGIMAPIQED